MKKGFTLIELLAVIVVIVVISLIAVPVMLNVIEKSKKGSAEASAYSYLDALNYVSIKNSLGNSELPELKENIRYSLTEGKIENDIYYPELNSYISLKGGYFPTGADDYVILNKKYIVIEGMLTINNYLITIENGKIVSTVKGEKIKAVNMNLGLESTSMEDDSTFIIPKPTFEPTNTSDPRVTYRSSDTSIVTVDEGGNVLAIRPGTATITITSRDNKSLTKTVEITVIKTATKIEVSATLNSITIGEKTYVSGTILPSDTTTSTGITWSSSNPNIATVSSTGEVTGISVGDVTITGTTVNGLTDTVDINVYNIVAESVSISSTNSTIYLGSTTQVTSTILPSDTVNKAITYTSSNTGVATVSSTGLVTSVSPGNTTITATTSNGKIGTLVITVNPILATSINITGSGTLMDAGNQIQLTGTILPSNTTNKTITWSSSNTSVATVSNTGLVTGISGGTTVITGKTVNNLTKTYNIEVISYAPGTISTDSIYDFVSSKKLIISGEYTIILGNGENIDVEVYVINGDTTYSSEPTLCDTAIAKMCIYKYNGNLTVGLNDGSRIIYRPQVMKKGFVVYVSGTLTNNGYIGMSLRGVQGLGQNVLLYKNANGTYEYIPAVGSSGAARVQSNTNTSGVAGITGGAGTNRGTGGGGSGAVATGDSHVAGTYSGAGAAGTSYSGGSGGSGMARSGEGKYSSGAGIAYGGAGGSAWAVSTTSYTYGAGGGAGNPGGSGKATSTAVTAKSGVTGTGGLLIMYANILINNGGIYASGSAGGNVSGYTGRGAGGGGSGGGSINLFYKTSFSNPSTETYKIEAGGGGYGIGTYNGGRGGAGTITIGSIATGTFVKNS